jgi:hypothetical protein
MVSQDLTYLPLFATLSCNPYGKSFLLPISSNPETKNGKPKKWTPCSPGDPKAVEKALSQIGSDELLEPPLRIADFLKSLDNTQPTVTQADIAKHDQWTMESGTRFSPIVSAPPLSSDSSDPLSRNSKGTSPLPVSGLISLLKYFRYFRK